MPKVSTKKKNSAGLPYDCCRCSDKITAGNSYYEWSFRYGGTYRQHVSHGSPKQSQLTQSKLSGAYAAIESAEEAVGTAESVEDLISALEECASEIDGVAEEYQESFDAIPENLQQGGPAQEMQEKIEALQSFSEELNSAAGGLEEFDEEEPEEPDFERYSTTPEFDEAHKAWKTKHDEWEEKQTAHLEEQRSAAEESLGNLSI